MKVRTKLAILLFGLSAAVVAAGGIFLNFQMESFFLSRIVDELEVHADETEQMLRTPTNLPDDRDRFEKIQQFTHAGRIRLTLIATDGTVLFESDLPYSEVRTMENHLRRPEIQEALSNGMGTSKRHSTTLDADMLYLAKKLTVPLSDKGMFSTTAFLRVGIPQTEVQRTLGDLRSKILVVGLTVLAFVFVLTIVLSRQLTKPVAEMADVAERIRAGDLEQRFATRSDDELGKLTRLLNGMTDKLKEDIVKLKKLERVRSEFLGNVSHELRTPLFALQGALDTLLHGAMDDPAVKKEFLQKALHHTERLDDLLSDLIEISQIESGEMKMSFRYFDIRELLKQTVEEIHPNAEKKNISVAYASGEAKLEVFGDRERIKQVMVNLLTNAVKYTDAGGDVQIVEENTGGTVRISVKDTGCGIPAEHQPRIFERFYRVDKDRSREVGGTGLGLAIVKHIVEAHGSSVEVQSEAGKGSTFSFTLKK